MRNILFSQKWPSLLTLALFLLAATYLVWPRASAPAHATLQQSTAGDWPMYMHTIERNSYNKTETLINAASAPTLTEKWVAPSPKDTGGLVFSQPVVANGVVYWGPFNGYEHATNVATDQDVWATPPYLGTATTCAPMSPLGVVSSAAVATVSINNVSTSVAYVGGGDDYLYALNTADGSTLWRTLLDPSGPNTFIWDSPVVFHNAVYIGTATTGEAGPCPQCGQGSISSAVWDGGNNLYLAGGTYGTCGGSLQDLDPATGTAKWQNCLPKTVLGSLTLVPGVIALIDGSTLSLFSAKQAGPALITWDIDKFYGSPSISNGVLYAGSKSGRLYAFSPTP